MSNIVADADWYSSISEAKSLSSRCPFATAKRCPRYYQSLSLLSETGATAIEPDEDARLLKKWKGTELWPKIREHETAILFADGKLSQIIRFCPEVVYDRFGLFCTDLGTYADEIDIDSAHKRLSAEGASSDNPKWNWSYAKEGHFSECSLYSVLSHTNQESSEAEPWWREHLSKIIVGVVIAFAAALFKLWLG